MVFIESPCGVGFSYSDTPAVDYIANDASTAVTNYHLIQGFFRRFPEYATNDLYLTSESYGGHCNLFFTPLASLLTPHSPQISQHLPKKLLIAISLFNNKMIISSFSFL
jgi:carboxypeptidase C (cathepsin A)